VIQTKQERCTRLGLLHWMMAMKSVEADNRWRSLGGC